MTVNILKLFHAAPSESFPPIALPVGIFSVPLITVGDDSGSPYVCTCVCGEAEMKGPLQIMGSPTASFPEEKEETYPKWQSQLQ